MDFNQHCLLEEEYYHHFQSLHNGLTFFKSLQQDSEESRLKINTLLYRPHDAPSTWSDFQQACKVFLNNNMELQVSSSPVTHSCGPLICGGSISIELVLLITWICLVALLVLSSQMQV